MRECERMKTRNQKVSVVHIPCVERRDVCGGYNGEGVGRGRKCIWGLGNWMVRKHQVGAQYNPDVAMGRNLSDLVVTTQILKQLHNFPSK